MENVSDEFGMATREETDRICRAPSNRPAGLGTYLSLRQATFGHEQWSTDRILLTQ